MEASRQDRLKEWEEQRRAAGFQSLAWGAAEAAAARQPAGFQALRRRCFLCWLRRRRAERGRDGLCSPPPELQPPASLPRRQASSSGFTRKSIRPGALGALVLRADSWVAELGLLCVRSPFWQRRPRDCGEPAGQSEGGFSSRSVCPLLPHVGF